MSAQEQWVDEIRKRAADGRVALVCGTGVAAALADGADNATWSGLLRNGIRYLSSIDSSHEGEAAAVLSMLESATSTAAMVGVAEWVRTKFGELEPGEYRGWLESTVGQLKVTGVALENVLKTNLSILTTNYDSLIEQASGREAVAWDEKGKISRYHDSSSKYVFHLHGHFDRPESVILSGGDYGRLEAVRGTANVLEPIVAFKTLIFIGTGGGLSDPNFAAFIRWYEETYAESVNRIYILARSSEVPNKRLDGKRAYLDYGSDYEDLPEFLNTLISPALATPVMADGTQTSPAATGASKLKQAVSTAENGERATETTATPNLDGQIPSSVVDVVDLTLGDAASRPAFQARALAVSESIVDSGAAALLSAVTGTGKTTIARVAMNLAVAGDSSAIMILPTKALVAQEVREWRVWESAWEDSGRSIRVYGSSRDYPENDSPVAKGRFEVAVAIYEKLAGYIVSGRRTLGRTNLVVIDELQTLVEDKKRAAKLEALLTMIRLLPAEHRPAILGLSATMSKESTTLLRDWLDIPDGHFIQTNQRPIPLDTYVVDAARWRIQPDAHLWNLRETGVEPAPFDEVRHALPPSNAKQKVHNLGTGALAVSLVVKLLKEDPSRRILVFVPGRTAAQDVARLIQAAAESNVGGAARRGNPWLNGRFASASVDEVRAEERYLALANSDLPMQDDILRGLRTGIAFHTARLAPKFRRDLEEEFVDPAGVLRVLVATDTLAVGVNLPADVVIATSISGYGAGRVRRLLTPAELDNKAGRAGRRGMTSRERGEFYILVPTGRDLQGVAGVGVNEAKTLSTIGGVYDRYVKGSDRIPAVRGQIREIDEIALLALQVLCADGFGRKLRALQGRVDAIISSLLVAQEPNPSLPSADAVIERLLELRLLTERGDTKIKPSRLGDALARSALELGSANVLELISRLAVAGAGDIDLLFNAARSAEMGEVTAWVALPAVDSRHYPSLKENIITYAMAYTHPSVEKRRLCAQYCAQGKYDLPDRFVSEGQVVISAELVEMFAADVEDIENADATALLRALVAFEWSRGVPFADIKARFSAAIHSDETGPRERPVELRLHYSDVEQLCEQLAGILRGASDISFSDSHDWSSRMRMLALQVEVGLPAWLAPIAKMRIGPLYRNRLSLMWQEAPIDDDWGSLLDRPVLAEHRGITDVQRDQARESLENLERDEAQNRHKVSSEWADELIPGADGLSFDELGIELSEAASAREYCEVLTDLGNWLSLDVSSESVGSQFECVTWSADGSQCALFVPVGELGADEVVTVSSSEGIVVLRTAIRPSGFAQLAGGPSVARFVQPEVILSVIARLCLARGEAVMPVEVLERLRELKISVLDSESVVVPSDELAYPPPFPGPMPNIATISTDPSVSEHDVD